MNKKQREKEAAEAEYDRLVSLRAGARDTANVEMIRKGGVRIVRGSIPAEVRAELRLAVKAGRLGHLRSDGLKPEVFYDLAHKYGAIEMQNKEAAYAISCIAKVMVTPEQYRESIAATGADVDQELLARAGLA